MSGRAAGREYEKMHPLRKKTEKPAEAYCELVLVQHELSKKIHQELFSFDESRYIMAGNDILESILALAGQGVDKMHIAADWKHLLMIALWMPSQPSVFDVMNLLKKYGASDDELAPFRTSDADDFFPWLYYGRKFDMLRKICNAAKAKAESRVSRKHMHIICHLVSEDTSRIVASSL
jgi:hypothetical protein